MQGVLTEPIVITLDFGCHDPAKEKSPAHLEKEGRDYVKPSYLNSSWEVVQDET